MTTDREHLAQAIGQILLVAREATGGAGQVSVTLLDDAVGYAVYLCWDATVGGKPWNGGHVVASSTLAGVVPIDVITKDVQRVVGKWKEYADSQS